VPSGRRLQLTSEGRELAAVAAEFLALEEKAMGALGSGPSGSSGRGPVRVAVFQTATHALVPQALTLLAATAPDLRVEIAELAPEQGLAEVAARSFDLAVAEQYPGHTREHHPGLARESLGIDEIRLASSRERKALDLESLGDAAWVMEPRGTAARAWAVQQCRAAGFEPDVRYEAADLLAHVRLIAAGHAVGLLPDLLFSDGVVPVHLAALPGSPHRDIFTATRESSRDRADIALVREALAASFAG
jgi:DNA-binding transcriptional LysR family regulator